MRAGENGGGAPQTEKLTHLVDEETDEPVTYQIVGDLEADLKVGKISVSSPLSRALIGKEVGASAEVTTPKGTRYYEVEKISFI
mgnify:CR=1 FL=1